MKNMKDDLISLTSNQVSPGDAKASDFSVKTPAVGSGMEGANKLMPEMEGPRHTEDDGPGTPVPTDRSRVIASHFKVGQAKLDGTPVKCDWSVSFDDGQISPSIEDKY